MANGAANALNGTVVGHKADEMASLQVRFAGANRFDRFEKERSIGATKYRRMKRTIESEDFRSLGRAVEAVKYILCLGDI
ncbi:MAG: hypothetical protein WBD53_00290 [Xanthobacteraceae bacterium]